MSIAKDLTAASASPLILSILSARESYGYAIIKRVRELSGGKLEWTEGMLYPVLHRLEEGGLLDSFWREEGQRKRKYYRITDAGLRALEEMREQWLTVSAALEAGWARRNAGKGGDDDGFGS